MNIVVQVADARVSRDPGDVIVTYSLGSCIGVSAYDPVARCGGILHYQLPTSTLDAARAQAAPCMFADTGMNVLLDSIAELGGNTKRLQVKLVGGAEILNDAQLFSIGRRNHTAIRKILWQRGLLVAAECVGGRTPRTLYLSLNDGNTIVKTSEGSVTL